MYIQPTNQPTGGPIFVGSNDVRDQPGVTRYQVIVLFVQLGAWKCLVTRLTEITTSTCLFICHYKASTKFPWKFLREAILCEYRENCLLILTTLLRNYSDKNKRIIIICHRIWNLSMGCHDISTWALDKKDHKHPVVNQPGFHVSCSMSLKLFFFQAHCLEISTHPIPFYHLGDLFQPDMFWGNTCSNWQCNNICWIRKGLWVWVRFWCEKWTLRKLDGQHFHQVVGGEIETLITKVVENLFFAVFWGEDDQFSINEKVAGSP